MGGMTTDRAKRYRVFVQDVGDEGFSGYGHADVDADSPLDAIFQVTGCVRTSPVGRRWLSGAVPPSEWGDRLIALPHSRKDLWPDGKTGKVPDEALSFQNGSV